MFNFLNYYVEVLTLKSSECDLIWSPGLYRDNQVKVKSLGIQLVSLQRGEILKNSHTEGRQYAEQ